MLGLIVTLVVGGFLGCLVVHQDGSDGFFQPSGLVGSILGAVIVLLLWTTVGGRRAVRS